ncbi:MAG: hypothetical protein AAF750_18715 [Planctomycetota bacterium]
MPFFFVLASMITAVSAIAVSPKRFGIWVIGGLLTAFAWSPPILSVLFMEWAIKTQGLLDLS